MGNSTVDSLWENATEFHALAGGQVDKKREDKGLMGIFNQHGEKSFLYQFALTTHNTAFDPVKAMRFSLEHQNPLVTGRIKGDTKSSDNKTFSLLTIDDPSLFLWSVKPSEDGIEKGLITRFWNMKSTPIRPTITFNYPLSKVWQTTHIETNERVLSPLANRLTVDFNQYQLNTYRLILK